MNHNRRIEYHDEFCCAGNFRRTSSLRLRGEKMVQRSPLTSRRYIPVITENAHQKLNDGGAHNPESNDRPRSHSLTKAQKPARLNVRTGHYIDRHSSESHSAQTPPGSPEDLPDDDSLNSYGSAATAASIDVAYAPFNGTTFSGKSMKYVLHCSSHAGLSGEEYLTPTQRAQKQIRRLKALLAQARQDLEKKDSEIFHLTKEVVELRLFKAATCSPEDKSNSSEIVTIKEIPDEPPQESPKDEANNLAFDVTDSPMFKETPTRCRNSDMHGSFTDSGHFDDLTNSSLHSKESLPIHTHEASCMTETRDQEEERSKLVEYYERKIDDLIRSQIGETQELKQAHNDKVEALLQKLSDVNNRYCELLPNYEEAKERIHLLEKQLDEASQQLKEEEVRHASMYVQMYNKGLQAAKYGGDKEIEILDSPGSSSRVSVEELLEQLQITQTELDNVRAMYRRIVESQKGKGSVDPEITLQFLKSAIYYFLTDPENHQGHLNAIENILGFTEAEKQNIRKARST